MTSHRDSPSNNIPAKRNIDAFGMTRKIKSYSVHASKVIIIIEVGVDLQLHWRGGPTPGAA